MTERETAGKALLCPNCGTDMTTPLVEPVVSLQADNRTVKPAEIIILERLKTEPPVKEQAPIATVIVVVLAIIMLGIGIHLYTQKPDVFADAPASNQQDPHAGHSHSEDSLALLEQRAVFQPRIDSLKLVLAANPTDINAKLMLANSYYDAELWGDAVRAYEEYLREVPSNADARVDYGFAIARADQNLDRAIKEMERALEYEPNHVNALFNAGILSLRDSRHDRAAAFERARGYFARAKTAAQNINNAKMAEQIDEILTEMDKVEKEKPGTTNSLPK